MKKSVNILVTIVLPLFLLVLLSILFHIQVSWIRSLYKQQLSSFESQVTEKTIQVSVLLEDELLLLSNLLRTSFSQEDLIKTKVTYAVNFWNRHGINPEIIEDIYFFSIDNIDSLEIWNKEVNGFNKADEKHSLLLSDIINKVKVYEKESIYAYFSLPDNLDLVISVVSDTNSKYCAAYTINKEKVASNLIPNLVESIFSPQDLYYLEITNYKNGHVIYTNKNDNKIDFSNPDYSWVIFGKEPPELHSSGYIRLQKTYETPGDTLESEVKQTLSVIRNHVRKLTKTVDIQILSLASIIQNGSKPEDNIIPNKNILLLKAVHKEGSVIKGALNTIIINATLGVVILFLLTAGLLSLLVYIYSIRRLTKCQTEFIATVTHELKTPLAVISSAAENMMEGIIVKKEKITSYGELIKKESDRLTNNINFFLMYSHLQSSDHLQKTACNICELIRNAVERMEPLFIKKSFEVFVMLQKEEVFIECDVTAFNSLLQNMIDNVLKHADKGKYLGISLEISPKNDFIVLKFIDKGEGISWKDRKNIYDVFKRGEKAVQGQIEGNGIGLNLVKRITELHKGTITLQSSLQGTIFTIRLPYKSV